MMSKQLIESIYSTRVDNLTQISLLVNHCFGDETILNFPQTYLTNHVNAIHLNFKPYKCLQCDYAASNTQLLREHVKLKHDSDATVANKKRGRPCAEGGPKYKRDRSGRLPKPFKCDQCDFASQG